jgi:hypothetical protein
MSCLGCVLPRAPVPNGYLERFFLRPLRLRKHAEPSVSEVQPRLRNLITRLVVGFSQATNRVRSDLVYV